MDNIKRLASLMTELEEGSERQIEAEEMFFKALSKKLGEKLYSEFEEYGFNATRDEMSKYGLELCETERTKNAI